MRHRIGAVGDVDVLAALNHQLIHDEGHRNPMSVAELGERMKLWIAGDYQASLFEDDSGIVAYALYRETAESLHLRQFFVHRDRRRQGIGRSCMKILLSDIWPAGKRITVDVLASNGAGISFWKSVGFSDYCLTLEMPARNVPGY